MLVDNPIVNSPFEEPRYYWIYESGNPVRAEGRRPSGYTLRPQSRGAQLSLLEEEFRPIDLVNLLRQRVRSWKEDGYPGVTQTTRKLLAHWNKPERKRRLFFCQLEAIETFIWLLEASHAAHQGIEIPKDKTLLRYACKMATGSGKTVVMAMLIAWQVLNKLAYPSDGRFSDTVLIVCPNLTVRERLQVLLPMNPGNYYGKFDIVPQGMTEWLLQARFEITNWHLFLPKDDRRTHSVVQRGSESDTAFCRRIFRELGSRKNILVINDEAHHAYRPMAGSPGEELSPPSSADTLPSEEELEEATVWIDGLDKIQSVRGISLCADFSATPFYIRGSGHEEGSPFPWVVSDFGLVDAIECGIVKIPRIPVDDNTGALLPRYFRLWEWINEHLSAAERQRSRRGPKPESVLREAEGAMAMLASEWKRTYEAFQEANSKTPPVMIIVCDNTELSKIVHEHVSSGAVISELKNDESNEVSIRIDSKLLREAESSSDEGSELTTAERLRKTVNTVGKTEWEFEGEPPGMHVRSVVSVGMLNEGWDAQNVTQILGLRAFTSQLLCEQVVGRGLRRMNYDDFSDPEYVDVYGIPFEVFPVKRRPVSVQEKEHVSTLVQALKERKHLEILFPRVEGYIYDVRQRLKLNIGSLPYLKLDPFSEPTEVVTKPAMGFDFQRLGRFDFTQEITQNRNPFHEEKRLQATVYEIAAELTDHLSTKRKDWEMRHELFPQVLNFVWRYLRERVVTTTSAPMEEVALLKYKNHIVERLAEAIEPDTGEGEPPILPIVEKFHPLGSTSEVLFRTSRPTITTTKSHVSHVVLDSTWERDVALQLERVPQVVSFVRNDHMDFVIPYEWDGVPHVYVPDFIVYCAKSDGSKLSIVLEVKGFESEKDRQKETAAKKWVRAVNYDGRYGKWAFVVNRNPGKLWETITDTIEESMRLI